MSRRQTFGRGKLLMALALGVGLLGALGQPAKAATLEERLTALERTVQTQQATINLQQGTINSYYVRIGALETQNAALKTVNDQQQTALNILQTQVANHSSTLAPFSTTGNAQNGYEVYLTGANFHIVNGQGWTNTANGFGNLIVGYNESGNVTINSNESDHRRRTGSHNLVIGPYHSYTSYGGLVAGYFSTVSAPYSSVTGGYRNTASGNWSSVTGGSFNTAGVQGSSVTGGQNITVGSQYVVLP